VSLRLIPVTGYGAHTCLIRECRTPSERLGNRSRPIVSAMVDGYARVVVGVEQVKVEVRQTLEGCKVCLRDEDNEMKGTGSENEFASRGFGKCDR
jgi:hypothetical protein